jgi:sugar phosphate isomerase/epimerase
MKVYVSTINFGFGPLPEIMQQISDPAYSTVEISSGHPAADGSVEATIKYRDDHGASILLHNFAPPEPGDLLINLAEADSTKRQEVIDFIKSRIDLTKTLGSDYYSFHGGYRVSYRFGVRDYSESERMTHDKAMGIFMTALEEVVEYANAQQVHIGVENHVVAPASNAQNLITYGQADFEEIFNQISSDYLHLHLDVGHIKVTSQSLGYEPTEFISAFNEKIMTAHLHDNSGENDEHEPFLAKAWFLDQLNGLPNLKYACLETKTSGDSKRISQMLDLLKGQ